MPGASVKEQVKQELLSHSIDIMHDNGNILKFIVHAGTEHDVNPNGFLATIFARNGINDNNINIDSHGAFQTLYTLTF